MPRGHLDPRPRVFERLVLQPLRPQPQLATEPEQPLLVGTHEMDHALAPHGVAVKPPPARAGGDPPPPAAWKIPTMPRHSPGKRPPHARPCPPSPPALKQ